MIINHNISATHSNRMFSQNVSKMQDNLSKLSTGERINQAKDDPAGLAVSEKMRGQVRGLQQASRNIQDASSLVQTAEGFLSQTNDVLHRMRELSVQASNGTYTPEDRAQITVELDEMVKEINRIHEDAKFNTVRLLDGGSLAQNSFGNAAGEVVAARNVNFNDDQGVGKNGLVVQSGANTDERMFVKLDTFNTNALGITGSPEATYADGGEVTNSNLAWREKSFYDAAPIDLDNAMYLESAITAPVTAVSINEMPPSEGNRLNVTTTENATQSITVVDIALNKVNEQRTNLGSFQNRLEKAADGVNTAAENLQAAESRIRNTDMAAEFVDFTKNQILSQTAASMTAQANMGSQLVMRILG